MSCVGLLALAAGAPPHSSSSTDDRFDDDHPMVQYAQRSRMIGGPLMMEAAQKVDKCLARLQSLQGTVTMPTPAVSATVTACISPAFSRAKSCIGSPKFERDEKEPVIRVHDILRFSDDFSGKFSSLTQEHRGKYLRRLSRSKTEVFDDRKDPRDPHGEWKHWSSGAGDVHKVVSEILMASQIAKEITSMVNACLVNTDVGTSEDEKPARRPNKYKHKLKVQASSSNKGTVSGTSKGLLRKEDPMHKFRVVTPSDGSKRRHKSGDKKEVLYPKSKLTAELIRSVDSKHEMSSTERKMQSRRSPRASVSPGTSTEEPVPRSRSKAVAGPADSSKSVATPRASVEESALKKSRERVTEGTYSRTAATLCTTVEETVIRTHVGPAGEPSRSSATRCASSVEMPVSRTPARVASEPERGKGTSRARCLEEPFLKRNARISAVSVEYTVEDPGLNYHARIAADAARVAGTPRASVEESLSRSKLRVAAKPAEPSGVSEALRASDKDDPVLKRIRTRVVAPESSSFRETPCTSVEDSILTRIRTHSSVEGPVLRNHARVAAESTRFAGTSRSSAEEPLLGNGRNFKVVAHPGESSRASGTLRASDNDPVLTRIRTRIGAPECSNVRGTPRTSVEDPVLMRIRARVAAAAEPLRGSLEEPPSKLGRAAAAGTPSKSATTSDIWEAKEITNCYNSPRAICESSKKYAGLPSSSTVKKVRNSRSPPQASQTSMEQRLSTSSLGAVQSPPTWRCNPRPSTPIFCAGPDALDQTRLVNSPSRSRVGILPRDNVAEVYSDRIRRAMTEPVQEPRILASSIPTSSPRFPSPVEKPSSTFVAKMNVDSTRIHEITSELPNDTIYRTSANASITSNGSLKGGRNDDWFRKSLEATEINLGPNKLWKSGNKKAVLFSNPTFAPASPPGARPARGQERSATPPVGGRQPSPSRSTSAARRMKEWVGNVLHGRRSVSPDMTERLCNSTRKRMSLSSSGQSLPSLNTRLPSTERKFLSSAPRATVFPSSSAPKEAAELPLPPCRQAQQRATAASKLSELPVSPGSQVMELRAQKEKMDRQALQMSAQKLMMVEDWNRTSEPPAMIEKEVSVAAYQPGPVLYSKRQLNDMGCHATKPYLKAMECDSAMLDKRVVPQGRYLWEPESSLPVKEEEIEVCNIKRGSAFDNKVGVLGVLSQNRSMTHEQPSIAASCERVEKENVLARGSAAVEKFPVQGAGCSLRKSLSTGSQRSPSTIRAMSTGKIRTGPSFLKRAKDWMRTQTPFRDRPQKTTDFS